MSKYATEKERRAAERVHACERKIRHATREAADTHRAVLLATSPNQRNNQRKPLTVYLCSFLTPHGRHWHVGHEPYWNTMSAVERLLNKRLEPRPVHQEEQHEHG